MPVTRTARLAVPPPVSRTVEPVRACSSRAVVGARTISSGARRHPPGREDDGRPFSAHRVVGEALHGNLPACAPAIRASSTPVTSRSAATARSTWRAGPKSCPFWPRNVSSCQVCPKRSGWVAASATPAEKVKAASTPSTPVTAPGRAGRTGTAERPRPAQARTWRRSPAGPEGRLAVAAATADRRCGRRPPPAASAAAAAADPASTRSGAMIQPAPSTSQSASMPGMRLGDRGHADRHPSRGHDRAGDAHACPGRRGQDRPGRGRRDGLPAGQAHRLEHL